MELDQKVQIAENLYVKSEGWNHLMIEPSQFRWAVVDDLIKSKLWLLQQPTLVSEAISLGITKEELSVLYNSGLIILDSKKRYNKNLHECNSFKDLGIIVLHTTNSCNFRCTYCYANAREGENMPFEVSKATVDAILRLEQEKPVKLEFHGGEPLLNFRLIKQTIEYANSKSTKIKFSMQTNASLLNENNLDFLVDNDVAISISIDGPQNINDKVRIYENGNGTYKDITKGLRLLQKHKKRFATIMVVTDANTLDSVLDFMLDHNLTCLKLNPYFGNQGRAIETMPIQAMTKEYAKKMLDLTDRVIQYNQSHVNRLKLLNISLLLKNILDSDRGYMCMRSPCGAGTSMLGVGTDGAVYPCEEMNGKKELIIGNILHDPLTKVFDNGLIKILKQRSPDTTADCYKCEIKNACEVSCANHSYNRGKNFNEKSEFCDYYKIMIPELIWKLYKNQEGILTLL